MTYQLDQHTALVVVDLQKGILRMPPAEVVAPLIEVNTRIVNAFHDAELPVVWVHATGLPQGRVADPIPEGELPADFTDLHDDLPAREDDVHVFKDLSWSAFPRTGLTETLRAQGVTQVVITGLATAAGVESTARSAYDDGFHVTVVGNATFDGNTERHRLSLDHAMPSLGFVVTSDDVLTALAAR